LIALPLHAITGQYKGLTRSVGSLALYRLSGRNGLLVLLVIPVGVMRQLPLSPLSSWWLPLLLLTGFTGAVRFALRDLLLSLQSMPRHALIRVAVYGARNAAVQLAAAFRHAGTHKVAVPGLLQLRRENARLSELNAKPSAISTSSATHSIQMSRRCNLPVGQIWRICLIL
jgi:FlaA1/EpsC-like NDP-sugar epimerase